MNKHEKYLKFAGVAKAVAAMSKDPSTKVGAVALDDNFNVVATGYNGFPRGVSDDRSRYHDREIKYKLISHAEMNLVAQAAYGGRSLAGATVLITTLYPCTTCTKMLIQAGVKRIVVVNPEDNPRWKDDAEFSKMMLVEASVEVIYGEASDGSEWETVRQIDGDPEGSRART